MKKSIIFIILISILSSVAPMGIDTYLPSIPEIAKYFDVNIHKVELSLSIFLIGFAIGQIFGGPISDRYGRAFSIHNVNIFFGNTDSALKTIIWPEIFGFIGIIFCICILDDVVLFQYLP